MGKIFAPKQSANTKFQHRGLDGMLFHPFLIPFTTSVFFRSSLCSNSPSNNSPRNKITSTTPELESYSETVSVNHSNFGPADDLTEQLSEATTESNVPRLQDLAVKTAGLPGWFYRIHSYKINEESLPVRAHLFSTLISFLFGIKRQEKDIGLFTYFFDEEDMHGLDSLWTQIATQEENVFTNASLNFLKWLESTMPYLKSSDSVRQKVSSIRREPIQPMKCELACDYARRVNHRIALDIKNLMPKKTLEELEFSYLALASFFLKNYEMEHLDSSRFICTSRLRYALALELFPETSAILEREIAAAVEQFTFIPQASTHELNDYLNIYELLRFVIVSQNYVLARKLIRKIDISKVDMTWRKRMFLVFRNDQNFPFLLDCLEEEGWEMTKACSVPSFKLNRDTDRSTHFGLRGRMDYYRLDMNEAYNRREEIEATCIRDEENDIEKYQTPAGTLLLIFPTGTVVTPLMVHILKRWSLADDLSRE